MNLLRSTQMWTLLAVTVGLSTTFSFSASAIPQAQTCVGCHGPGGKSVNPLWPSLAGQKKLYLAKQLKDFRSGKRKDPMMGPLTQTLSTSDIEALAEYYSKQK